MSFLYLCIGYCKSRIAECHDTVHTDEVSGVEIVPPSQVFNGEVPATISLLFSATVTSQHNTALLDIREYQWDFGDGTPLSSSDIPTVSHTYSTSGTYTVSLTVHAPFVSGNGQASLDLIVYKGEWGLCCHSKQLIIKLSCGPYNLAPTSMLMTTQKAVV